MKPLEKRRQEAQERSEAYNKLNTKQKITLLDLMFGEGLGAKRQRNRLAFQLAKDLESKVSEEKSAPKKDKKPYQKPKRS